MVSLQRAQGHGFAHFCGGSIIEDDIVLTAAHCIQDKQASEVKAVFGTEDLSLSGHHITERNVSKMENFVWTYDKCLKTEKNCEYILQPIVQNLTMLKTFKIEKSMAKKVTLIEDFFLHYL